MNKHLKQEEVIDILSRKIEIKKKLREARKDKDDVLIDSLSSKLSEIETKLKSTPLSKT